VITKRKLINAAAISLLILGAFLILKKFHNPAQYIKFPVVIEKVKNNEVTSITITSKRYGKVMQQPQFQQLFHGRLKNGADFKSVFPVNEKLLPYHVPYLDTFKEHGVDVEIEEYAV
jgi:hypothetical protein